VRTATGETAISSGPPRRSYAAERAARLQTRLYDFESKTNATESAAAAANGFAVTGEPCPPSEAGSQDAGFCRALHPECAQRHGPLAGVGETACRFARTARGVAVGRFHLRHATRAAQRITRQRFQALPARTARPVSRSEGSRRPPVATEPQAATDCKSTTSRPTHGQARSGTRTVAVSYETTCVSKRGESISAASRTKLRCDRVTAVRNSDTMTAANDKPRKREASTHMN